jgi:entericidin B
LIFFAGHDRHCGAEFCIAICEPVNVRQRTDSRTLSAHHHYRRHGIRRNALSLVCLQPHWISRRYRVKTQPILDNGRLIMIKKLFSPLLAALFLAGLFGSIAGCNTVEGAGKDIEQGGKAIKDEAKENKNY